MSNRQITVAASVLLAGSAVKLSITNRSTVHDAAVNHFVIRDVFLSPPHGEDCVSGIIFLSQMRRWPNRGPCGCALQIMNCNHSLTPCTCQIGIFRRRLRPNSFVVVDWWFFSGDKGLRRKVCILSFILLEQLTLFLFCT